MIAEVHIKVKNAFAPPENFLTTLGVTIRLPLAVFSYKKWGETAYCIEFKPISAWKTKTFSKTLYFRMRWRLCPNDSCIKHFRSIGLM